MVPVFFISPVRLGLLFEGGSGGSSITAGQGCCFPRSVATLISLGNVFCELRRDLIEKNLVLKLRLGDPEFHVRLSVSALPQARGSSRSFGAPWNWKWGCSP